MPCRSFWTPADISHANRQLSQEAVALLIGKFFFDCRNLGKNLKFVVLSTTGFKPGKGIDRGIQLTGISESIY